MKNYLLNEAGFDYVHVLTQDEVTRPRVNKLMSVIFPDMLEQNDRFLFYWSGHGETIDLPRGGVMGYLPLAKSDDFSSMINMNDIKEWDKLMGAKQTLYLLDSCFSGLAGKTAQNSVQKQTIKQLAKPSRQMLTAGTSKESTYVLNDLRSIFLNSCFDISQSFKIFKSSPMPIFSFLWIGIVVHLPSWCFKK